MKAIAYSIKSHEKESLVLANGKKHDLTLISNELNLKTVSYAVGKQAVIISSYDILDEHVLRELRHIGITNIITRSVTTTHIDLNIAMQFGFKIANIANSKPELDCISKTIIDNLNNWEIGNCLHENCCCTTTCKSGVLNNFVHVKQG